MTFATASSMARTNRRWSCRSSDFPSRISRQKDRISWRQWLRAGMQIRGETASMSEEITILAGGGRTVRAGDGPGNRSPKGTAGRSLHPGAHALHDQEGDVVRLLGRLPM